jgi:AbiV family abortive infection protein
MQDLYEEKAKLDKLFKEWQKNNPQKRFEDLKREECLLVYDTVIQNAKEHLEISDLLANNKKYGSAITHAVLASEEMTKALILFVNGKGIRLNNIKGFVSFFYGHQPRHKLANFMTVFYLFLNPLMELLKSIKENDSELNEEKVKRILDKYQPNFDDTFNDIDWWFSADDYKNRGLYVDYNNKILSPSDLTESDFRISLKTSMGYIMICNNLIESIRKISDDDFKKINVFCNTKRFNNFLSTMFSSCVSKE